MKAPALSLPLVSLLALLGAASFVTYGSITFSDTFDSASANWSPLIIRTGPSITVAGGQLLESFPRGSTPGSVYDSSYGALSGLAAFYSGQFGLVGDFDAQVDSSIANYTPVSTVRVQLGLIKDGASPLSVGRVGLEATGSDVYLVNDYWAFQWVPTTDSSCTLRRLRSSEQISGHYWSGTDWNLVGSHALMPADLCKVQISLRSGFVSVPQDMAVALLNFRVTADSITSLMPSDISVVPEPSIWFAGLTGLLMLVATASRAACSIACKRNDS